MSRRAAWAMAATLAVLPACRPRDEVVRIHRQGSDGARAVASVDFTQQVTVPDNFILRPDEFGAATPDPARGLVYVGSREGTVLALRDDDGAVEWETSLGGAVSSPPVPVRVDTGDGEIDLLLIGTDNGAIHALDLSDRKTRWVYETPGRIHNAPIVADGVVFFVNSRDQVYALDLRSGAWRWQYEQDFVNDFTVYGHAGLTYVPNPTGEEVGVVYTGFSNGKVAALGATSGEALWLSSVAPDAGGDFIDCDSTPLVDTTRGEVYVTGQSTGVYALSIEDGSQRWMMPLRGAGSVVRGPDGALLVASSLEGIVSLDPTGTMRWRAVADPGVVSIPTVVDDTVFVTHSEIGLLAFDYDDGEMLAQLRTGSGMSGTPVFDPVRQRLYAVSNRGMLVALRVGSAVDEPFAIPTSPAP